MKLEVKVGQVWEDNDPRVIEAGRVRQLEVVEIFDRFALCQVPGVERKVRIALNRFKPTSNGYRLVKDVK